MSFVLSTKEWCGLYLCNPDCATPHTITVNNLIFKYDREGALVEVYNVITTRCVSVDKYMGATPPKCLPGSLCRNDCLNQSGLVYIAMGYGSRGMLIGLTPQQLLFYEYDTKEALGYKDLGEPRNQKQMVAVMVQAYKQGDHETFIHLLERLRHPGTHLVRTIHHNPKYHILIPFLKKDDRNMSDKSWYGKMVESFQQKGILGPYLELAN